MAKARTEPATATRLAEHLRALRLPAVRDHYPRAAETAAKDGWTYPQYLEALTTREVEARA